VVQLGQRRKPLGCAMKLVIYGSRSIRESGVLLSNMTSWIVSRFGVWPSLVISGTAPGADRLGEKWATDKGIPVQRMPADWDQYGIRAGRLRNTQMAEVADGGLALWDGKSRGTAHMTREMERLGKPLYVVTVT
jgi:hypothetical protein